MKPKTEGTIWDSFPGPYSTPDQMSVAAAASILGGVGAARRSVAEHIAACGPVGTWEIERDLSGLHQSISPRVLELHRQGAITRVGTGRTPSGRPCWLYAISDLGLRLLEAKP